MIQGGGGGPTSLEREHPEKIVGVCSKHEPIYVHQLPAGKMSHCGVRDIAFGEESQWAVSRVSSSAKTISSAYQSL